MRRHLPSLNRRLFPALAVLALLFLGWDLAEAGEIPQNPWVLGVIAYAWSHGSASNYVDLIGEIVEDRDAEEDLPDWVEAQSEKNRRKARFYLFWAVIPFFAIHLLHRGGWLGEIGLTALLAANLAFQVGAFAGERVIMVAQGRLLRDVEGWAGTRDAHPVDNIA